MALRSKSRRGRWWSVGVAWLGLAWLAGAPQAAGPLLAPPVGDGEQPLAPWHLVGLPQQTKPFTRFGVVTLDGQRVLRVEAVASYGNLVHGLNEDVGKHQLAWRWRLEQAPTGADLRKRDGDDIGIKVCAMFDLATSAVPFVERQVLRIARLRATELLPAASICYVWDSRLPPGTVLDNAFTRRIRQIVLRGSETATGSWVSERRDVWADFRRLFADEAEAVPPMVGVAIGADADNTQSRSLAYLSAITLE